MLLLYNLTNYNCYSALMLELMYMWKETKKGLYQEFTFKDFKQAFNFMTKVAELAEEQQHHPRWHNTWSKVDIWLTTHSENDSITDKDHRLADAIDNIQFESGVEETKSVIAGSIKMFADGGSRGNPGPSASGFVLLNLDDTVIYSEGIYLGITTNNQAEYQAVKFGLEEALKLGAREISVYLDSLLVVNQMTGIFKVKNRDLWPINEAIHDLVSKFKRVSFTHVPRELNKLADAEVNKALDAEASK